MKEPVYIVDGSGYIFRAYYAIRPLSSRQGVPTNAVYGFSTMLQKLIKDHQPKYLAIAFDTGEKNFRHQLYSEYKSNRPPPPEDLIPQFGLIRRLVEACKIAQFYKKGFEADDIIGTLTHKITQLGHPVVIVTGDKDMMQLVNDQVCLLDELRAAKMGNELWIKAKQVREKLGVNPEQVVDLLALAGDTSDHVPGVRGIGVKTASELIQEHGNLESVLNYAPFMKQKSRREKLIQDADMARLSKKLVQIDCEVNLAFELQDLENQGPDMNQLNELYRELDFKSLVMDIEIEENTKDTEKIKIAHYLLDPEGESTRLSLTQLEKKLHEEGLWDLYANLEIPLQQVLHKMETTGILLDVELLYKMGEEFADKIEKLEKKAHDLSGKDFNLASPKQVAQILFHDLGLKSVRDTKTSQSTDSDVLEALSRQHELPKILLEHRMLSKLKNTYVDALPKLADSEGRVHTHFNQTVTATGRLSSSHPNLQNIPIRTQEGRRIREAFIAKPGYVLISLDYSQIELRILAHVTEDPVMIEAFKKEQDVHQRTASEIFQVDLREVTSDQRRIAKTINFGLLYGMGVHKLSQTLDISRAQATEYLSRYHARYTGIFKWQKHILEKARQEKQVKTLMGRRRLLHDIDSSNRMLQARAERIAVNTCIQGTAADIVKKAMLDVDRFGLSMLLQVHDELVIECPREDAERVAKQVQESMEKAFTLRVPMHVEYGIGLNWSKAH